MKKDKYGLEKDLKTEYTYKFKKTNQKHYKDIKVIYSIKLFPNSYKEQMGIYSSSSISWA